MIAGLVVADDLTLPLDAATETFWFAGKRGSGKTHNASVLVEELIGVGVPVAILDPMHAWYGLRSSADGEREGLPVLIAGGPRADIPLDPAAGALMAEFIVEERIPMIFDVKGWSKAARARFVEAFLLTLLDTNREALHVVLEEAARFAPQRPERDETRMLGACMDLVQLGRGMGLGATLVSQRSATISTEVASQTSVLCAHRTRSPHDLKALREWFTYHERDEVADAMRQLPTLATGEALVLSDELDEELFRKVRFRRRHTFDSSATPKVGQVRTEPRVLADIDLDVITEQVAAMVETAMANDPRTLQTRVRQLEQELADAVRARDELAAAPAASAVPEALLDALQDAEGRARDAERVAHEVWAQAAAAHDAANAVVNTFAELTKIAADHHPAAAARPGTRGGVPAAAATTTTATDGPTRARAQPATPVAARPRTSNASGPPVAPSLPGDPPPYDWQGRPLALAERRIISVQYQFRDHRLPRPQLAFLCQYHAKTKAFTNAIGSLRSSGIIDSGTDQLTLLGIAVAEEMGVAPLPTGPDLVRHLQQMPKLEASARRILGILLDLWLAGEHNITVDDLAARLEYHPKTKAFTNGLGRLRGLNFVAKGTPIRFHDDLLAVLR